MSSSAPSAARPKPDCAQCAGRGWVVTPDGDRAHAEVCTCLGPCERCGGRGHVLTERPGGYVYATPCACAALPRRVELFNAAGIPARYATATLEEIDDDGADRQRAKYFLLRYRDEFRPGARGVLLAGPPGTGKTHMIAALLGYFALERGIACRFVEFGELLGRIKEGYATGRSEAAIVGHLLRIPVLAIDELGKGRGTEWELAVLDSLVNRRYNAGLSTFFTTNYPIEATRETRGLHEALGAANLQAPMQARTDALRFDPALQTLEDRIGARMFSRVCEMCHLMRVAGEDWRRRARRPRGPGRGARRR